MNIFRTFELFLSAPESLIKKRRVKIVHIETNAFNSMLPSAVEYSNDECMLAVYNNKKVYKLLSSVLHKRRMKELELQKQRLNEIKYLTAGRELNLLEDNKSEIYIERAGAEIMS